LQKLPDGYREAEAAVVAQRPPASRNSGRAAGRAQRPETPDQFEAKIGEKVPTKLKLDAAPLINQEPVLTSW
jgi:hypothetical protein